MNDTLPDIDLRVSAFAAAVRAELADLPADDVDELVDGLEADLAEQASESPDFSVPDAAAYAAELRSAAGFPERNADAAVRRAPLRERLATALAAASAAIRSSRAGAWLLDFLMALRPVWWVARGWAVFALLRTVAPGSDGLVGYPGGGVGGWLLLGGLVLLSVQWGRGVWVPARWLRVMRAAVSIVSAVALVLLVPAAVASVLNLVQQARYQPYDSIQPGLTLDGERLRNVFAYDSEGNPLVDVQLFDQNGRPLTTVGGSVSRDAKWDDYFFCGGGPTPVPLTAPGRAPVWNVFPLHEVRDACNGEPDRFDAVLPTFPFPSIPAVQGATNPQPTPTGPTGEPTPTPPADDAVPGPTPVAAEAVEP